MDWMNGRAARSATPLLTLGGIAAAFGLAACCALPMFLMSVGIGTAWLGGIALYAELRRPEFLAVALIGLVGGTVLLWWQRKSVTHATIGLTAFGLLVGLVLLYFGYRYA